MSYLPRLSKTYKEPQILQEKPLEDFSRNTLKPASAILNEKTFNPQIILKHYRYIPHAPPVLPGPSLLEEALENGLRAEAYRLRRFSNRTETLSNDIEITPEEPADPVGLTLEENEPKQNLTEKIKRIHSRKSIKGNKSNGGRKRLTKTVKKDSPIIMNLTVSSKPFTAIGTESRSKNLNEDLEFIKKDERQSIKREKTILPIYNEGQTVKPKGTVKQKELKSQSAQCIILESPSRVEVVIPPVINSMLKTLGFLLQEMKKEEAILASFDEKNCPVTQAQAILCELCNYKVSKDLGIDMSYSDFKRLEKISGEFQKYIKDTYGDSDWCINKMEDFKRIFIESKSKELEFSGLMDKLQDEQERQEEPLQLKDDDLKYPDITLQNKRLESEQLYAEVEFSSRELTKFQKTIAELDWDIRTYQEQVTSLKKSVSKSKTEVLGRKSSTHKFSSENSSRASRNSESGRRKT